MSTNQNTIVIDGGQQAPFGFIPVLIVCGFIALVIHFFWYIVAVGTIGLTGFIFWLLWRDQQLRSRELLARAKEQDRQYLAGDPRGTYG